MLLKKIAILPVPPPKSITLSKGSKMMIDLILSKVLLAPKCNFSYTGATMLKKFFISFLGKKLSLCFYQKPPKSQKV
ncbi:MAG: hypothetical protein A2V60_00980 [Candidatus Portnoybacteria bacterium RIFCSPHIGHO2_01_FULL_39_19]|nr:MAG: hypothetical protein A2V60_00980 [Candidatus Portnoybacteria bacterium RIFCSPHIGHO2_01_FULL_39_19]